MFSYLFYENFLSAILFLLFLLNVTKLKILIFKNITIIKSLLYNYKKVIRIN